MAKKKTTRKRAVKKPPLFKGEQKEPFFATDAVLCMAATGYNIREAIQDEAAKQAEKSPISLEIVQAAIVKLKLTKFMEKEE